MLPNPFKSATSDPREVRGSAEQGSTSTFQGGTLHDIDETRTRTPGNFSSLTVGTCGPFHEIEI